MTIVSLWSNATGEWNWSARAGLNYDYISQDYYLLTSDTLGLTPDSLLELKSYSDRIDERGAFLRLDLERKSAVNFAISNKSYLSNDKLRHLLNLKLEWGRLKVTSFAEFKSYNDTTDFSLYKSQFQNSSRLGLELLSNDNYRLEISEEFEYSGYQDRDPIITGYYQSESRLKLTRKLGSFSDLDFLFRFDRRENYDSAQLDLSRLIVDIGFSKISTGSYLSATCYAERRNYALPDSEDDYFYIFPAFFLDQRLSNKLNLAPEIELQYYLYDTQDIVTFSNWRLTSELKLKYHYHLLSTVILGLGFDQFAAVSTEYSDQDFRSFALLGGYETLSSHWFSISVEGQFGARNYLSNSALYYTDYQFLQFDLLADLSITKSIRFSCIGGFDFEYHDLKENDIFLYMLSAGITYQIK